MRCCCTRDDGRRSSGCNSDDLGVNIERLRIFFQPIRISIYYSVHTTKKLKFISLLKKIYFPF